MTIFLGPFLDTSTHPSNSDRRCGGLGIPAPPPMPPINGLCYSRSCRPHLRPLR